MNPRDANCRAPRKFAAPAAQAGPRLCTSERRTRLDGGAAAREHAAMQPERARWGPSDPVAAAVAALPTRRHAELLFDAVAAELRDLACVHTADRGAVRRLFRRDPVDPTLVVPWPLLELNVAGRFGVVSAPIALREPEEPPPPRAPTPTPKLRGLGPGEIRVHDGAEVIELVYDERGANCETSQSNHPQPLAGLVPALSASHSNPIERLACFLAAIEPGRHGPGRVWMPAATPHGPASVWHLGRRGLRRALFTGPVDREASWGVGDGLTGTAIAFGATREQACQRWHESVVARPPWPEPKASPKPPTAAPPGAVTIRAPAPDVPWPAPVPENVPAAIVRLQAGPGEPPPFGSWTLLLGARGATFFAACRRKARGFTLIGQHVLPKLDLAVLDAELDRIDERAEASLLETLALAHGGVPRWPCRTMTYAVDEAGRLSYSTCSESPAWDPGGLDGDRIAQCVVRQRWVD